MLRCWDRASFLNRLRLFILVSICFVVAYVVIWHSFAVNLDDSSESLVHRPRLIDVVAQVREHDHSPLPTAAPHASDAAPGEDSHSRHISVETSSSTVDHAQHSTSTATTTTTTTTSTTTKRHGPASDGGESASAASGREDMLQNQYRYSRIVYVDVGCAPKDMKDVKPVFQPMLAQNGSFVWISLQTCTEANADGMGNERADVVSLPDWCRRVVKARQHAWPFPSAGRSLLCILEWLQQQRQLPGSQRGPSALILSEATNYDQYTLLSTPQNLASGSRRHFYLQTLFEKIKILQRQFQVLPSNWDAWQLRFGQSVLNRVTTFVEALAIDRAEDFRSRAPNSGSSNHDQANEVVGRDACTVVGREWDSKSNFTFWKSSRMDSNSNTGLARAKPGTIEVSIAVYLHPENGMLLPANDELFSNTLHSMHVVRQQLLSDSNVCLSRGANSRCELETEVMLSTVLVVVAADTSLVEVLHFLEPIQVLISVVELQKAIRCLTSMSCMPLGPIAASLQSIDRIR